MDVANAPGDEILPGELAKALEMLAAGDDIDYVGASAVELIGPGESAGNYREIEFVDGDLFDGQLPLIDLIMIRNGPEQSPAPFRKTRRGGKPARKGM